MAIETKNDLMTTILSVVLLFVFVVAGVLWWLRGKAVDAAKALASESLKKISKAEFKAEVEATKKAKEVLNDPLAKNMSRIVDLRDRGRKLRGTKKPD